MTNTFTPTTNAKAIPTIIAQEVIRLLPGYMNLAKTVAKDTDFESSFNVGDTLTITKTGSLEAKQKTPGTAIVSQNPTADGVDVKLDQHWYVSMLQEDITKLLQKPNMQAAYAEDAAITLAEKIETFILALHPTITDSVKFDASSATTIEASFLLLRERFARRKVPAMMPKYAYLDTSVINKLLSVDKYSRQDAVGNNDAIVEGAIRKIYGFNIFESQLVPTTGSPVAYHNLAYARNGICLVTRPMTLDGNGRGAVQRLFNDANTGISMRLTESYDTQELGTKVTMDVLFGGKVIDQKYVTEVESF